MDNKPDAVTYFLNGLNSAELEGLAHEYVETFLNEIVVNSTLNRYHFLEYVQHARREWDI